MLSNVIIYITRLVISSFLLTIKAKPIRSKQVREENDAYAIEVNVTIL